jgi:hypothetical protein
LKKLYSGQKFGNLENPDAQKIQENFFRDAGKYLGSFENFRLPTKIIKV